MSDNVSGYARGIISQAKTKRDKQKLLKDQIA